MVLTPAVIALTLGSLLLTLAVCWAAWAGLRIAERFDLKSGAPEQLAMERQTYLLSTVLGYVMAFQLATLFLYVYAGESLHVLFVGAMCAVGSFAANDFGYPTLMVKIASSVGCGVWLIFNWLDSQAPDYPLIKTKYRALPWLAGLIALESVLQLQYFRFLVPNLITSCCGTLFSENAETVVSSLAAMPPRISQVIWFTLLALLGRQGFRILKTGRGGRTFGWLSLATFLMSIVALVSFISVYWYQLPTHHCPFCVLKPEYHYVGYPMFAAILAVGVFGGGTWAVEAASGAPSLSTVVPVVRRRLCLATLLAAALLAALALYPMLFTSFRLE